jgi:hypothetical protein
MDGRHADEDAADEAPARLGFDCFSAVLGELRALFVQLGARRREAERRRRGQERERIRDERRVRGLDFRHDEIGRNHRLRLAAIDADRRLARRNESRGDLGVRGSRFLRVVRRSISSTVCAFSESCTADAESTMIVRCCSYRDDCTAARSDRFPSQ